MARQDIPSEGTWGAISALHNANYIDLYSLVSKIGNTTIINSESDFPIQDVSSITLEDEKSYIIGKGFSTSKYFSVGKSVSIFSFNPGGQLNTLEYTGSSYMFQGQDLGTFFIKGLGVRAPNGGLFNISDTAPNTIINIENLVGVPANGSSLVAQSFGVFSNILSFVADNASVFDGLGVNQGITFIGSIGLLSLSRFALSSTSPSCVFINLGTSVFSSVFEVRDFLAVGPSGSVGISGLTGSANLGPGLLAVIRDSEFLGGMTPLVGVTSSDVYYEIKNCLPLSDSTKNADSYLLSSQTVTVSGGAYSPIGGTNWQNDVLERFTGNSNGELTYIGASPAKFQVLGTATVSKVGGGADIVSLVVQINGTESAKTEAVTQNANPTALTSVGLFTLSPGDVVRMAVANLSTDSSIVVSKAVLNVIDGF